MEEDKGLETSPVFAVASGDKEPIVRVDRKVTVYRNTTAPNLCFGMDAAELVEVFDDGATAPAVQKASRNTAAVKTVPKPSPASEKKSKKEEKKDKKRKGEDREKEGSKKKKKDKRKD